MVLAPISQNLHGTPRRLKPQAEVGLTAMKPPCTVATRHIGTPRRVVLL
jgi:hypothetical protein